MADFKGAEIPVCYASCSIGHDSEKHTIPEKIKVLAGAGFDAIELSMPDILAYGQQISERKSQPDPKDYATLRSVASDIGKLCEKAGLKILMLQPFANFEGWPKDSDERKDAWERAKGWMSIMEAVGTDMLQVSGTACPSCSEVGTAILTDPQNRSARRMQKASLETSMSWHLI
jgi:sugar phosphate isomerase/epimerase